MLEYVVDQGSFHTIPLFFLVSGYITSGSFHTDSFSLKRFLANRLLRVLPPFLAGVLVLCIQRAAQGEAISIAGLLLSHLWFLWALALIQTLSVPFCSMVNLPVFN